jgi:sialate O-acetylesterase
VRGIIWYQGESNADDAPHYKALLQGLIADWRSQFGNDLPVLVVQLANYGPAATAPAASDWATLREAQRLAVAQDAHAALAVAIDIGERTDIHPANKQELGRRLARAARHVVYGESIAPSGPVPLMARRDGQNVVVSFKDIGGGSLVAYGAYRPVGFELCGADQGSCRFVEATLQPDRVVLEPVRAAPAPTRVRFCWGDSPVCTLYDKSGLPAGPFEMPIS